MDGNSTLMNNNHHQQHSSSMARDFEGLENDTNYGSSPSTTLSPVKSFYSNKSIFITGATGFIGKVLVEKLLHECPSITKIYLLLRSKNGHNAEKRLDEFFTDKFFQSCGRVKEETLREKVTCVVGDITQPRLGLSETDRQILIDNVSIVFHSAASVKFDDPLKECLEFNVLGTKSVMDICHEIKHLDVFVHVSTAYAYCQQGETEERLYGMKVTPDQMLEAAKWMDRETLDGLKRIVFDGRPNTYTFTKALAEHYVSEKRAHLPVAIARPSIVTATWKEPVPGWVDSVNGPGGASLLGSLGIARTMKFKPINKADLIPVDIVSNALINIAWYTGTTHAKSHQTGSLGVKGVVTNGNNGSIGNGSGVKGNSLGVNGNSVGGSSGLLLPPKSDLKIYNITSGEANPITWKQYLEYGREEAIDKPSMRVVRPPAQVMDGEGVSKVNNLVTKWVSELLFAYFIDFILIITGGKARMVRLVKLMHRAFDMLGYFARREWRFPCNNLFELANQLTEEDRKVFFMDVRGVDWRSYIHDFYMGIRRYLLKEDDSNIPDARKRMKWVRLGYRVLQLLCITLPLLPIYYLSQYLLV